MQIIQNINELDTVLKKENDGWQKKVFEATGVAVVKEKWGWELISNCGNAELTDEEDPDDGFTIINSISELVDYIRNTEAYQFALKDIKIGSFKKSELFWAIYYRVLLRNRYENDSDYVFGLKTIEGPDWQDSWKAKDGELWFDASLRGIDSLSGIVVDVKRNYSLDSAVSSFATAIDKFLDPQDEFPEFSFAKTADFFVPESYEEVYASRKLMQY